MNAVDNVFLLWKNHLKIKEKTIRIAFPYESFTYKNLTVRSEKISNAIKMNEN